MYTNRTRIAVMLFAVAVLSQVLARVVLAEPPPEVYSPWGRVTIDGEPAADDTAVTAWIDGVQYASTLTINGWYSIDVPADDPETPAKEGGENGDTVVFRVDGLVADQTGAWVSLAAPWIDLTVSTSTPTPTHTPTPTSTPTPTNTPTPTSTPTPTNTPTPTPAALTLSEVRPPEGRNDVTISIDVYGFHFPADAQTRLGSTGLVTTFVDDGHLVAKVPAGLTPGAYDVTVLGGGQSDTLAQAFTVLNAILVDDLRADAFRLWTDPVSPRQGEPVFLGLLVQRLGGQSGLPHRYQVKPPSDRLIRS